MSALEILLLDVSRLHTKELVPARGKKLELTIQKDKLEIPSSIQIDLFEDYRVKNNSKKDEYLIGQIGSARTQIISYLYEKLISIFYGGFLCNAPFDILPFDESREVRYDEKIFSLAIKNCGRNIKIKPDVVNSWIRPSSL